MAKQTIRLNEDQLNSLIKQAIIENCDETFLGGLKGAVKNIKKAASGELNKFKRGALGNGLKNEYDGESVGDRFKTAGKTIKRGFKSGDKTSDLDNAKKAINKLLSDNILSPEGVKAAQRMVNIIDLQIKGSNGGQETAYRKAYGPSDNGEAEDNDVEAIAEAVKKAVKKAMSEDLDDVYDQQAEWARQDSARSFERNPQWKTGGCHDGWSGTWGNYGR